MLYPLQFPVIKELHFVCESSLCFFVPIVDTVIRALRAGKPRKTQAIIVYPMNALANSQMKEIEKFIGQSGLPDNLKPVVKRYTGQESQEERQKIAANPPDVLLTNYMMAELLLTRQDDLARIIHERAQDCWRASVFLLSWRWLCHQKTTIFQQVNLRSPTNWSPP
jgi:ATP-dependent helicase YprA (DUF1998 family)